MHVHGMTLATIDNADARSAVADAQMEEEKEEDEEVNLNAGMDAEQLGRFEFVQRAGSVVGRVFFSLSLHESMECRVCRVEVEAHLPRLLVADLLMRLHRVQQCEPADRLRLRLVIGR